MLGFVFKRNAYDNVEPINSNWWKLSQLKTQFWHNSMNVLKKYSPYNIALYTVFLEIQSYCEFDRLCSVVKFVFIITIIKQNNELTKGFWRHCACLLFYEVTWFPRGRLHCPISSAMLCFGRNCLRITYLSIETNSRRYEKLPNIVIHVCQYMYMSENWMCWNSDMQISFLCFGSLWYTS